MRRRGRTGAGGPRPMSMRLLPGLLLSSLASLLLLQTRTLAQSDETVHVLKTTYEGGWIQDGVMFDVRAVNKTAEIVDLAEGDVAESTVAPDGVVISGMNILTPLFEPFCVELYTKSGSYAEASSNANAWTLLGSFTLTGMGPNVPTTIPVGSFEPVVLPLGETQGFYVTTTNEKLRYTALQGAGLTGEVYASSEVHLVAARKKRGPKAKQENPKRRKDGYLKDYLKSAFTHQGKKGGNRNLQADFSLEDKQGLEVQILTGVAKDYPFEASWPHRVFNGALLYTLGTQDTSLGFLSQGQWDQAHDVQRGLVTCLEDANPPTDEPTMSPIKPTQSPTMDPTKRPTLGPTVTPSEQPTDLESTIRKVATTLHGGLKQSGCMFDLYVPTVAQGGPEEGVTIIALETSTFIQDEDVCVEVYSKEGTYEGFEDDVKQDPDGSWESDTWEILGAVTVEGRGERQPTVLPIGTIDPVYIPPGGRRGFYVTLTEPEMRYTEPRFGENSGMLFSVAPEGHVQLLVGSAVSYPFGEIWRDRIYNGAVVYTLGDVPDARYNDVTADDRARQCPQPTDGPTASPTKNPTPAPVDEAVDVSGDSVDDATTVATVAATNLAPAPAVSTPAAVTTAAATAAAPSGDVVDVSTPSPTTPSPTSPAPSAQDVMGPRLKGICPGTIATDSYKEVIVPYQYTVITDDGVDVYFVAEELETAIHSRLMKGKCAGSSRALLSGEESNRALAAIAYRGFDSDPPDVPSEESCAADLTAGQQCTTVTGGVTAVVPSAIDDAEVEADVGDVVKELLLDPTSYEGMGVQTVGIVASSDSEEGDQGAEGEDTDTVTDTGTDEGTDPNADLNVGGAQGEDQSTPPETAQPKKLSKTGVAIISALSVALFLLLVGLAVIGLRKRRRMKRADSKELFQEFPDEEERARDVYGGSVFDTQDSSFAPVGSFPEPPPPPSGPPPRPGSRTSSRAGSARGSNRSVGSASGPNPAFVVNEQDNISQYSGDRFRSARGVVPDSPASRGSRSSRGSRASSSSKRSVEFVQAGQSFGSGRGGEGRPTSQPEDTVDL